MAAGSPEIHLRKDGPFFRVSVAPREALPADWSRPSTYTAHSVAADTARLLAEATGYPITDKTKAS